MRRILQIVDTALAGEDLPEAVRQRLRVRLARAIAANHRDINQVLQQELGEVRQKAEDLLYPVPLDRMESSGGEPTGIDGILPGD